MLGLAKVAVHVSIVSYHYCNIFNVKLLGVIISHCGSAYNSEVADTVWFPLSCPFLVSSLLCFFRLLLLASASSTLSPFSRNHGNFRPPKTF